MYLEAPRHLLTKDCNQNLQKSASFLRINCSIREEKKIYTERLKIQKTKIFQVSMFFLCFSVWNWIPRLNFTQRRTRSLQFLLHQCIKVHKPGSRFILALNWGISSITKWAAEMKTRNTHEQTTSGNTLPKLSTILGSEWGAQAQLLLFPTVS